MFGLTVSVTVTLKLAASPVSPKQTTVVVPIGKAVPEL
jgi:hypothetical protein